MITLYNGYYKYSFMVDLNVNFKLDKSIHNEAKALAIKKDMTIRELYTKWIMEGLRRDKNQTSLDEVNDQKQS